MSTRAQYRQEALKKEGGWKSTATSGSTTTIHEDTTRYIMGAVDTARFVNQAFIYRPNAAVAGDKIRIPTVYAPTTGKLTVAAYTTAAYAGGVGETYEHYPLAGAHPEMWNDALNSMLMQTHRLELTLLPTLDDVILYSLAPLTWLTDMGNIYTVYRRNHPSLLRNGSYENFSSGLAAVPDFWVLGGTGAAAARVSTANRVHWGGFSCSLTRGSANLTLAQTIGSLRDQLQGQTVTFEMWVWASVASQVRLQLNDGVTTTSGSYHTGGSTWELLTVTKTLAATAQDLIATVSVETSTSICYVDDGFCVEGSSIDDGIRADAATFWPVSYQKEQTAAGPAIRLDSVQGRGSQLWVMTSRPYATVATVPTADTESFDCPLELGAWGLLANLYDVLRRKEGQDVTQMTGKYTEAHRNWRALQTQHLQKPPLEMSQSIHAGSRGI